MKKFNVWLLAAVASMGMTAMVSCGDDNKTPGEEPDTKVDPSTIAASNLIAYFPFEGNGNEATGSGLTPANANNTVTYVAGARGQAYQGSAAITSGLLYNLPASSPIKTLTSFSFSMWAKLVANTTATTSDPEQMLFHLDGTGDWIWGNLFFLQHRNYPENTGDWNANVAPMDVYFWKEDAVDADDNLGWRGQRADGWKLEFTSSWRHIICTYDAATSEFHGYVNGQHIVSHKSGVDTTVYTGVKRWQAAGETTPLGALKFTAPQHFVIGHWADKLIGTSLVDDAWAGAFRGGLDEFRIYNKGLTETEAKDLYAAELSQLEE
ncbi:hypothetical protein AGMMS4956_01840 [Bacteroidia bacterium]|nr:hypothetical protein AGMMS4956_01840 [Bacteroidia bacterium]